MGAAPYPRAYRSIQMRNTTYADTCRIWPGQHSLEARSKKSGQPGRKVEGLVG